MAETMITVTGHIASDVDRRQTQSGRVLTTFRVASATRVLDKGTGAWSDGPASFFRVACWGTLADNVADSLARGMPVIVHGRIQETQYQQTVGDQRITRSSYEIRAVGVGPDLSRGVAQFRRAKSRAVQRAEERALADVGAAALDG